MVWFGAAFSRLTFWGNHVQKTAQSYVALFRRPTLFGARRLGVR